MKTCKLIAALLLLLPIRVAVSETNPPSPCVRFIYVVSADREVKDAYLKAIDNAAHDIQKWYAGQLDGAGFALHDPVVEVVKSDKSAAWFTENPCRTHQDNWGFRNTMSELVRLCGARPGRDGFVWVAYSDGPGNKGRAIPGYAYLPEDDLLGLVGKHPTQKDPLRWIGGLGHELGHALGLPHPKDTKKHYGAIMWAGFYGRYPNDAYLTDEDKAILAKNPLIVRSATP